MEGGEKLAATTLVNAAPFVKGVGTPENGHTPLFRQLIADGAVRIDRQGLVETDAAGQARPGLAVVGPASHRGPTWGAESFRGLAAAAGAGASDALQARNDQSATLREPASNIILPRINPSKAKVISYVQQ